MSTPLHDSPNARTGVYLTIAIVVGGVLLLLGWLTGFPWPG